MNKVVKELRNIYKQKIIMQDNIYKIKAYKTAISNIIKTGEYTEDVKGIGKSIMEKINYILQNPGKTFYNEDIRKYDILLKILGERTLNSLIKKFGFNFLVNKTIGKYIIELNNVDGIGSETIKKLYNKYNIKNVKELKNHPELHTNQIKKYFEVENKLVKKISRNVIENIVEDMGLKSTAIIVGSYRRKKKYSSDIDIMVKTFPKLERNKVKVITKGEVKSSIYYLYNNKYYHIDFLKYTKENKPFKLLYFTGSFEFNIEMRKNAKNNGYLLNEYGIFDKYTKKRIKKTEGFSTEKDIFKFLDMVYVSPENRF